MISLDSIFGKKTHMPYLANGPSGIVLFFCLADANGKWRLHYLESGNDPVRIETGISVEGTECAPTAWYDQDGWHIYYISGGEVGNRTFFLRLITGKTLQTLSRPTTVRRGIAGFVRRDLSAIGEKHDFVHLERVGQDAKRLFLPGAIIYAVSYPQSDLRKLLISCALLATPNITFCLEYDLETGEQNMLECDGDSAYKCSILDDCVTYPKKMSDVFEDRAIHIASSVTRTPSNVILGEIDPAPHITASSATGGVIEASNPLACIYRGKAVGTVGCGCGANGSRMTVYECEKLGICTLRSPNKKVEFDGKTPSVCLGCTVSAKPS